MLGFHQTCVVFCVGSLFCGVVLVFFLDEQSSIVKEERESWLLNCVMVVYVVCLFFMAPMRGSRNFRQGWGGGVQVSLTKKSSDSVCFF